VGPLGIGSTNQNEGKLASQNSGQNRPEKPRQHHRSQNSGHEASYYRANLAEESPQRACGPGGVRQRGEGR
jgi:hypothetical protein